MKKMILALAGVFFITVAAIAQKTEAKVWKSKKYVGDVIVNSTFGARSSNYSVRVYNITVPYDGYLKLEFLINIPKSNYIDISADDIKITSLVSEIDGWQSYTVPAFFLPKGAHTLLFNCRNDLVPMVEEISMLYQSGNRSMAPEWSGFLNKMRRLEQQPVITFPSEKETGDLSRQQDISPNIILPNPQGIYDHAIDTPFNYSHFSWVYLNPGSYTFTTSGSTIVRTLSVFNPSNITYTSSANVNSGPGGESSVTQYVTSAAYYAIMLRPMTDGQTGTTNILMNGTVLVANATIGGKRYSMSQLKGGNMNFFTCKLNANADTRLVAMRYPMSSARGYNDDYNNAGIGDWNWGLSSRIKKDFSGYDSVQYAYVCAYSPASTGICDVYMGTGNSNLHDLEPLNFPLLKNDDAIKTGEANGSYNCISWSGGITTSWSWPPGSLSFYNCNGAPVLQCFDNFYSNNPLRYPGAWNYTRTGATVNNSVVDLWKRPNGGAYQHASVRKPGNSHPHGYDWESKPGSTNRTLHPRYALTQNNWYGVVNDYYIHNGTYANLVAGANSNTTGGGFATDMDAVNAGVAVLVAAGLTDGAQRKLKNLLEKIDPAYTGQFHKLYTQWDNTKAANTSASDPSAYCQNKEYEAMAGLCSKQPLAALLLVMEKFVNNNDHLIGELFVSLAKERYNHLLQEVKEEHSKNPYDKQGRFKIQGDHDNGVLYAEKILKQLTETMPVKTAEVITLTISPNPVQGAFNVKLQLGKEADVQVVAISAQTRRSMELQKPAHLNAGLYQYNANARLFAGNAGDIITIQATVNGVMTSYKVLVAK